MRILTTHATLAVEESLPQRRGEPVLQPRPPPNEIIEGMHAF